MRRAVRVVALVLLLGSSLLLPAGSVQGHLHHLYVAVESLGNPRGVEADLWLAQSFVLDAPTFVTRVSLYVKDVGSNDELTVALQGDQDGFPDGTDLAAASVDGPNSEGWLAFDYSEVELQESAPYWVVARSGADDGKGYDWWDAGGDVYADGRAVSSQDGGATWDDESSDHTLRVYGYRQPSMSFGASAPSTVLVGTPADLEVTFANEGDGTAARVWVNLTLPPELRYVDDDAAAIGGVLNGSYSYAFTDVAPGTYVFNVSVEGEGGVPDGTAATVRFTYESQDHNGNPDVSTSQDLTVTVGNADLDLRLTATSESPRPGDRVTLTANLTNRGAAAAQDLEVVATLDDDIHYVASEPSGTVDAEGDTVTWTATSLGAGESLVLEMTVEVPVGTPDGTVLGFTARADGVDPAGSDLPSPSDGVQGAVRAPAFDPVLLLDAAAAEKGDEVRATLHYNNTGSDAALRAWANWTLADDFELLDLNPAVPSQTTGEGFALALTDVAVGSHAVTARLRVLRGMDDGRLLPLRVTWTFTDGNGNPLASASTTDRVQLRAPEVQVSAVGPSQPVDHGALFAVNVTIRNTGSAGATGQLVLLLPAGVEYLGDNLTLAVTAEDGRVVWDLGTLAPGATLSMGLQLRRTGAFDPVSLRVVAHVTDGKGSPTEEVFSNAVPVEFHGSHQVPLWAWGLGLMAAGLVAVPVAVRFLVRSRPRIEEVFVVHKGGTLLAHRSRTLTPDKDRDLLASMFQAVQEFAKDAFRDHEDAPMRSLEFGDHRVLIAHGGNHYVAVVHRGEDDGSVARGLERLSRRVEAEFGDLLATWEGDMQDVKGLNRLLPVLWGETPDAGEPEAE